MKQHTPYRIITALAASLTLAGLASLQAQDVDPNLIAYDGMDYPFKVDWEPVPGFIVQIDNSVEGDDGGIGWAGPWTFVETIQGKGSPATNTAYIVEALDYNGPIDTIGNAVHLDPSDENNTNGATELARALANPIKNPVNTRTYISFIGQRAGPPVDPLAYPFDDAELFPLGYPFPNNLYPRGAALRVYNSGADASGNPGTPGEVLQIGHYSDVIYPQADENNPQTPIDEEVYGTWEFVAKGEFHETDIDFTDLVFVVCRIDHNGDKTVADSVYVWFDPDVTQPEDTSTAQVQLPNWTITELVDGVETEVPQDFSDIKFMCPWAGEASGNRPHAEFFFDELRVGRTWTSVTPGSGVVGPETFGPWEIAGDDTIDTLGSLGVLDVANRPWTISMNWYRFNYIPEAAIGYNGAWVYIPGAGTGPGGAGDLWAGYPVDANGNVYTGLFMGSLIVGYGDWVWCKDLGTFLYLPESSVVADGAWAYVLF